MAYLAICEWYIKNVQYGRAGKGHGTAAQWSERGGKGDWVPSVTTCGYGRQVPASHERIFVFSNLLFLRIGGPFSGHEDKGQSAFISVYCFINCSLKINNNWMLLNLFMSSSGPELGMHLESTLFAYISNAVEHL